MGAVNIFLGGTGKHIAEDIQDSKDFFGLTISEPIAFDLDASTRPGVDLRGFVFPSSEMRSEVKEVARKWAQRGPVLSPEDGSIAPGPRVSPEHSVLVAIGEGVAKEDDPDAGLYALRGHGLAVFSTLFDPAQAIAGTGVGNSLRRLINAAIADGVLDGDPPRINLITSTAGGTGAGTVIPLALWLRANYPASSRNLVAVTPDAFSTVLLEDNPDHRELADKGRSGTYALLRELSLLHGVDPKASFLPRQLPVTQRGLEYAPGGRLFNRVYWFGGREAIHLSDAFEEAGTLVRILSTDNSARELDGKVGANPLQNVGAITTIEYPKLRLQRKMVSQVLRDAYDRLRSPRSTLGNAAPLTVDLLDYVRADTGRKLGAWFAGQRSASLAPVPGNTPLSERDTRSLIDGIAEESALDKYNGVSHGLDYDASPPDWQRYVTRVTTDMNKFAQSNQRILDKTIPRMREEEEGAFAEWLRESAFGADGWLSGDLDSDRPYGIADVKIMLEQLDERARELEDRVDDEKFIPGATEADLDDRIKTLTARFVKPFAGGAAKSKDLSWPQRGLGLAAAVAALLTGSLLLQPLWNSISRFGEFGGTAVSELLVWIGVILAAPLAYRLVTWGLFFRSSKDLLTLRREAEENLFDAYRERDRIRAIRWLHKELCRAEGKPAFFRALRHQIAAIHADVDKLDSLYKRLYAKAAADAVAAADAPAHVHETVGDCIKGNQGVSKGIIPEMARRLRVDATPGVTRPVDALTIRLQALDGDQFTPVDVKVDDILDATAPEGGEEANAKIPLADSWNDALWELVNWQLGAKLPGTFVAALTHCAGGDGAAATRALVGKLNTLKLPNRLKLPRRPSVDLNVAAAAPLFRQLYVGDLAILASFKDALADPALDPAVKGVLRSYGDGQVVGSLGQQIVFLDLWADGKSQPWAPHIIGNATEAEKSRKVYYNTTGAVQGATARDTCFTVLPELLAATKIELGGIVEPLAPVVTARLLGSDLDLSGPTYAELFYLLRARNHLRTTSKGMGPETKTVVQLDLDGSSMGLVEFPPGSVSDARFFGSGRGWVTAFDAFCDFMRFDGASRTHDDATRAPYDGTRLFDTDWAADPRRVARLQRAAVMQWYEGNIEADCEDMVRVLDDDVEQMDAVGDEAYKARESWNRAMRRLIDGEERRRIRSTLMTGM